MPAFSWSMLFHLELGYITVEARAYIIGIAVVGHFKLSQDGTSGCLTVLPATSES